MTQKRITCRDVQRACDRYNKAHGFNAHSIGFLQWGDVRGDGLYRPGLWVTVNTSGGIGSSYDLRGKTKRETIARIEAAMP
jgi:hypothetical protein